MRRHLADLRAVAGTMVLLLSLLNGASGCTGSVGADDDEGTAGTDGEGTDGPEASPVFGNTLTLLMKVPQGPGAVLVRLDGSSVLSSGTLSERTVVLGRILEDLGQVVLLTREETNARTCVELFDVEEDGTASSAGETCVEDGPNLTMQVFERVGSDGVLVVLGGQLQHVVLGEGTLETHNLMNADLLRYVKLSGDRETLMTIEELLNPPERLRAFRRKGNVLAEVAAPANPDRCERGMLELNDDGSMWCCGYIDVVPNGLDADVYCGVLGPQEEPTRLPPLQSQVATSVLFGPDEAVVVETSGPSDPYRWGEIATDAQIGDLSPWGPTDSRYGVRLQHAQVPSVLVGAAVASSGSIGRPFAASWTDVAEPRETVWAEVGLVASDDRFSAVTSCDQGKVVAFTVVSVTSSRPSRLGLADIEHLGDKYVRFPSDPDNGVISGRSRIALSGTCDALAFISMSSRELVFAQSPQWQEHEVKGYANHTLLDYF